MQFNRYQQKQRKGFEQISLNLDIKESGKFYKTISNPLYIKTNTERKQNDASKDTR